MYNILFFNQPDGMIHGRAYDSFISAYCLARLGYTVIYISSRRQGFIQNFYEGPLYNIDEIFDDDIDKRECTLQPSLHIEIIPNLRRNTESVRDAVEKHGKIDYVWVSGDADWASFANQVSVFYDAPLIHADRNDLSPCVNAIQLGHVFKRTEKRYTRIITCSDSFTDEECHELYALLERLRRCGLRDLQIYFVGRYGGQNLSGLLDRYPEFCTMNHTTDRGRIRAIRRSMIYIQPRHNVNLTGIAEALCCGTPAGVCENTGRFNRFKSLVDPGNIYDLLKSDEIWQSFSARAAMEGREYGFDHRMAELYGIIKEIGN